MTWYPRYMPVQKVSKPRAPRAPTKWAELGMKKEALGDMLQDKFNTLQKMDEALRLAACKKVMDLREAYLKKHNLPDNTPEAEAPKLDQEPIPNRPFMDKKQPKGMNYAPWPMISASELAFRAFYPTQWGELMCEPCKSFYGIVAAPPALDENGVWVLLLDSTRQPALLFAKHAKPDKKKPETEASPEARLALAHKRFPVGGRVKIAHPTGKVSEPLTENNDRVFIFDTEMMPKKAAAMNNTDYAQAVSEHSAWGSLPKKMNDQFNKEAEFIAEEIQDVESGEGQMDRPLKLLKERLELLQFMAAHAF